MCKGEWCWFGCVYQSCSLIPGEMLSSKPCLDTGEEGELYDELLLLNATLVLTTATREARRSSLVPSHSHTHTLSLCLTHTHTPSTFSAHRSLAFSLIILGIRTSVSTCLRWGSSVETKQESQHHHHSHNHHSHHYNIHARWSHSN